MGAFGLPTENYAIKNHIHPAIVTERNIARFTEQLKSLGLSFDWDRTINTTDPDYFKWTQWIFLKLYEKGLAYKKEMSDKLLHLMQGRSCKRGGRKRRLRALRK